MATDQEGIKFYIPADEAAELKATAREQGRTVTGVLRILIRRWLAEQKALAEND